MKFTRIAAVSLIALVLTVLGFVGARSREIFSGESYVFLALYLFVGKWLYDTLLSLLTREIFRSGAAELLVVAPMTAIYAAADTSSTPPRSAISAGKLLCSRYVWSGGFQ